MQWCIVLGAFCERSLPYTKRPAAFITKLPPSPLLRGCLIQQPAQLPLAPLRLRLLGLLRRPRACAPALALRPPLLFPGLALGLFGSLNFVVKELKDKAD